MTRVIFQPAGNAGGRSHYADTIANPVPLTRIAEFVPADVMTRLRAIAEGDAVPVWGVTPGARGSNERKWERVEAGDKVLFLQNGRAVSSGTVLLKTHSPDLANALWGKQADGQTWEFVYFVGSVRSVDIPYAQLNAAAGYRPGNQFMGFTILEGPQTDDVLALLGDAASLGRIRLPKVWCVRGGREGVALQQFLEQGVVGVGWVLIGDPRRFGDDVDGLKSALREAYPGDDPDSSAGNIRRFLKELGRGDVVVTPASDAIYVGRIQGEPAYEDAEPFRTLRPVEWLTAVSADKLTDAMRRDISSQLSVFHIQGGAEEWLRLAAAGPRSAPRPAGQAAWLVRQSTTSNYGDREGLQYEYPARIPNGRQIQADDVLVCYRNQDEASGRPIFGLGRIGRIDPNGPQLVATYDRYLHLPEALSWQDIGGDPRNNPRNSINLMPPEALERLLERIGQRDVADLPKVTAELRHISEAKGVWRPEMTLEQLADLTFWTREQLDELCTLIRDREPQVILAGPPGTSKTWVARHVCRYLTQREGQIFKTVQFHPSYSYEEFIEGLRPDASDSGVIVFRPVPGVLLRLVTEAGEHPGPHVLLIDEINRANLPKVLGELLYLFEYRKEPIDLRYRTGFVLPATLRFVGTMNTADRSIRSIDSALRRRFAIAECPPSREILERYYTKKRNDVRNLLDGFDTLNDELRTKLDRHHTIGHAFFMDDHLTRDRLARIWKYRLEPLLEEYFFDQPDIAASFNLEDFWPPS